MGHRRHSQPRRGSLAYLPRGRAKSMEARIRAWPNPTLEEPHMLAHVGFKAGCIQVVSIDDREKTPNHGKQLVSLGTVLVTPPVTIIGLRGYTKDMYGTHATFDIYAKDTKKHFNVIKLFLISPPVTGVSNMYGFFCSNPASRGEIATMANMLYVA